MRMSSRDSEVFQSESLSFTSCRDLSSAGANRHAMTFPNGSLLPFPIGQTAPTVRFATFQRLIKTISSIPLFLTFLMVLLLFFMLCSLAAKSFQQGSSHFHHERDGQVANQENYGHA